MTEKFKRVSQKKEKTHPKLKIVILSLGTIFLINMGCFFTFIYPKSSLALNSWMEVLLDVDRLPSGDLIVTNTPIVSQTPIGIIPGVNVYDARMHQVYIMNPRGEITWRYTGLNFPHEVESVIYSNSSNYLIADTGFDRVLQINSLQETIWEFLPKNINWTKLNNSWDEKSYLMRPIANDWTHLNDVDFINGSDHNQTFDSLLISIRNFDLILLLNYTAEYNEIQSGDKFGSTDNIYWWFGPGILGHQHNPDLMPNGNIVVCDSEHNRILEVNKTTNEVVFDLTQAGGIPFKWPRDADYNSLRDSFLISDSANNRIIETNRKGEILWEWTKDLALPYEADFLENGNIFLSGSVSGAIYEIARENKSVIWTYKVNQFKDYFLITFRINNCFVILLFLPSSIKTVKKIKEQAQKESIGRKLILKLTILLTILILLITLLILSSRIIYGIYYPSLVIMSQL